MITKHFDYQEFIKTKSLNCESCGGGLTINMSNGKTSDCQYCGNTNMILEDGKTKVIEKPIGVPTPKDDKVGSGKKMSAGTMAMLVVGMCVVGIAGFYIYKKIKERDSESKKRKRILLINH
jgi:hypothetical protein